MATGDKIVTLDGLKAVYDSQDTDSIKQDVADLKSSIYNDPSVIQEIKLDVFISGGISASGSVNSNTDRIRTASYYSLIANKGGFVKVDPPYAARFGFYDPSVSAANFIAFSGDPITGIYKLPDAYIGKVFLFEIQKKGHESDDISADLSIIGNYIHYYCSENYPNEIRNLSESVFGYDELDDAAFENAGGFLEDTLINFNNGGTSANTSYPHIYGSSNYFEVSKQNPLFLSSVDEDTRFLVAFYTGTTQTTFVGRTSWLSSPTIFNGIYNDLEYNHIRIDIRKADNSYGTNVYNQIVSDFSIRRKNEWFISTPGGNTIKEHRFYVSINTNWPDVNDTAIDTEETETDTQVRCVIKLPTTYNTYGKPTPLIMFGHGASAQITDDMWYSTSSNVAALINAFVAAGYAVFDVNNTRDAAGGFPDWGGLPLMTAYIKAWQYIKRHYNVEKKLYIFSDSMGTCANLNMLKWYGAEIITSIMTAPRPICKLRYESLTGTNKTNFETAFGITSGAWEDRLNGFNHYENIVTIGNKPYVFEKFPPVKVMVGTGDADFLTETRAYYTALANNGNYVNYREVADADHAKMSFLSDAALRAEAVEWFDRFRYKTT